ncbi:MAG: PEP-CTERM sorting domain-containing protein [Verrucomicrobia bacterium]|nr:MAG: PEP-CTERM sorting domain-containing protein [Verrucomicrobiota bacterium]
MSGALLLASRENALAQSFGWNIIRNPDAESGPASPDVGQTLVSIPNWTTTDRFTVLSYASALPTFGIHPSDPGPADRGNNLFTGGTPSAFSTASQTVDVSSWSSAINGPGVNYELSGWIGGWQGDSDPAVLEAQFLGFGGANLGSASIGPVSVSERLGQTGLFFRSTDGVMPVGTLQVNFLMSMTRLNGTDNDGYADNPSFVATAVPEPESMAIVAGMGILGFALWRRARLHRKPEVV